LRKAIEDVNSGHLQVNKIIPADNMIEMESPAEAKLQGKNKLIKTKQVTKSSILK